MKQTMKDKGPGFYLGALSAVLALVSMIGCLVLGGMTVEVVLLAVGILAFVVTAASNKDLMIFASYFCYLVAGCLFLADQLYTITNVAAGIDATSFETSFVVAAVAIVLTILTGLISTIPSQRKGN